MVTGIETAGLVLAAFPIVISALEHYRKGLEPFKDWVRYRQELKALHRLIKREETHYRITCELLLSRLVDGNYQRSLLCNPGGDLWKDISLRRRISSFLLSSLESFDSTVEEINECLQHLVFQLDVDHTGKPKRSDHESLLRIVDRLRFAFFDREKRKALQKKLEKANRSLKELVGATLDLAPFRSRRALQASQFEQIRQNACCLHDVLRLGPWNCQCATPHNANLRLEARMSEEHLLSQSSSNVATPVRFRVLFSFTSRNETPTIGQWDFKETDIVPLADDGMESTPSDASQGEVLERQHSLRPPSPSPSPSPSDVNSSTRPSKESKGKAPEILPVTPPSPSAFSRLTLQGKSLEQIQDLCGALKRACDGVGCLGYLVDGSGKKALGLYPMTRQPRDLISLEALLRKTLERTREASTSNGAVPRLTRKDRLALALTLASSILQLCTTPWLDDHLCKNDILFFPRPGSSKRPMTWQPYICQSFASSLSNCGSVLQANQCARSVSRIIRNKALFDLGVLLIELCFNKTLEDMREPEDLDDDGRPNAYTDMATADRLIDDVYNELGSRYGDAVRRCIYCDLDQREKTFDSDEFRQAVYQGVVAPLEDDLRDFCGGKLPVDW